jgi:hypothetical protein
MTERHFIVYERNNSWQYTYRGSIAAPFKSRDEAVAAAIQEAKETGDPEVAVLVQDHDMQQEIVWRHAGEGAGT